MTHPEFRRKLEAIGFGFFIPVFFVTSGVRFDLDALLAHRVEPADGPGLPRRAARRRAGCRRSLYRRVLGTRQAAIAGLHAGDVAAVHRRRDRDRRSTSA